MIFLFNLFVCFIVQFGTVIPYNMGTLNAQNEFYIDNIKSRISSNYNGWGSMSDYLNIPNDRWVVIMGAQLWGSTRNQVTVLCPCEDINGNSSSISCNSFTSSDGLVDSVSLNFNNYVQFFSVDSYINNPYLDGYRNFSFGSSEAYSLLYCFTPIYYNNDIVVDSFVTPPVLDFSGHASGWSDTLEDVDGFTYTVIGHSDISNSDSFDLVSSSSSTVEKLLKAIGRINSGMSDNISFGFGTLISLFNQGLDIIGLDGVSSTLSDIYDLLSGTSDSISNIENNVSDYIAWVSEPFDAAEFDLALQSSGFDNYTSLANNIKQTINMARVDSTHVYITLDLSDIAYFSSFGSQTYDLANYLNGSKNIWQPFLLTFIYATIFWGFFRSVPNIIGGASPLANSVEGVKNNAK